MSYKLLWIYFEKYRNSKALANQFDWFEKNIGIKWHDAHESDKTHTFFKSKSNRDKSAQQNFTYDFFDCILCVCFFAECYSFDGGDDDYFMWLASKINVYSFIQNLNVETNKGKKIGISVNVALQLHFTLPNGLIIAF